jgi:hypothetical protein
MMDAIHPAEVVMSKEKYGRIGTTEAVVPPKVRHPERPSLGYHRKVTRARRRLDEFQSV